jgi:ClpP class serine protease
MAQYLPLMMQNLFNTPICLSDRKADMIVAALSGRLNIQSLQDETTRLDARALRDLADMGRAEGRTALAIDVPEGSMPDSNSPNPYQVTGSGIAVMPVQGTLTRTWGVGPYSGTTGYDGLWTQLAASEDDHRVKARAVLINSGGGAVDGLFDLTDGIYAASARFGGKPIYAFAADYAHSAAYAIGSACDHFTCPPMGGVGSIGAICLHADISRALDEAGIEVTVFRSHARKAIGIMGTSLDDEEKNKIQTMIETVGDYFCDKVALYRDLPKSVVSGLQGSDYMGVEARAIGLVNEVLSEPLAWAQLERIIAR